MIRSNKKRKIYKIICQNYKNRLKSTIDINVWIAFIPFSFIYINLTLIWNFFSIFVFNDYCKFLITSILYS